MALIQKAMGDKDFGAFCSPGGCLGVGGGVWGCMRRVEAR
jgi:hypothetical protein